MLQLHGWGGADMLTYSIRWAASSLRSRKSVDALRHDRK